MDYLQYKTGHNSHTLRSSKANYVTIHPSNASVAELISHTYIYIVGCRKAR